MAAVLEGDALRAFKRVRLWHVLLVSWLTYCCYTMVRRPFSVARADIEEELAVSAVRLSWVDTSFIVTYSLAQLLYGTLRKHVGYTRILFAGFFVSILSCIVLTQSNSVLLFTVVWGVNGLAQGTGWASCMELLSVWVFPHERGSVMGVWSTNMAVGGVLGNVVPACMMGRGLTWRTATLVEVFCGPCIVLALGVMALWGNPNKAGLPSVQQVEQGITVEQLRETPKMGFTQDGAYIFAAPLHPDTKGGCGAISAAAGKGLTSEDGRGRNADGSVETAVKSKKPASEASAASASAWVILRLPGALGYSLSYCLHKLVRYAFMFWLPYYLKKALHTTSEKAGYVASAFDVGGVLGIVLSGYLSDCLFGGRRRILVLLMFTAGMAVSTFILGTFSSAFAGNQTLCTGLVLLVGLFSFAIDALQSGPCLLGFSDALGAPVGAMSGVVGGVGSLGSALQGVFTAVLSSSSWSVLFLSFSAATALAGLLMARPLAMEHASIKAKA